MKKSDLERLKKIVKTWHALQFQINDKSITEEMILKDEFAQWAVTTPLYNIGEQAYYISDELKKVYPALPWKIVAGLRHRLVHDYEGINWTIINEVIFHEMDTFVEQIQNVIDIIESEH